MSGPRVHLVHARRRVLGLAVAAALVAGIMPVASTAAAADHFVVTAAAPAGGWVAGASYEFTVFALQSDGGRDTTYAGTVFFGSTDAAATLPADHAFVLADHGAHTFSATLRTAGSRTIGATDRVAYSISGASGPIAVVPAAPIGLSFRQSPGGGVAGAAFPVQPIVAVRDSFGNTVTTATTAISLELATASGSGSLSCSGGTSATTSSGSAWFAGCSVSEAGTYQVGASAPGFPTIWSYLFTITPAAAASHFVFSAPPTASTGVATNVIAWATRADGFVDNSYRGTVHVSSSDGAADLPADYTFTATDAGTHTFSMTFATAGLQTVTLADVAHPAVTSTSLPISVAAAGVPTISVSASPGIVTYGRATTLTARWSSGGSGTTLALYSMGADTTTWTRLISGVTGVDGSVSWTDTPVHATTYSVVCEGGCPGSASISSMPIAVSVRCVVSLAPETSGVRVVTVGTRLTYTARVTPVVAGVPTPVTFFVYRRSGGRWAYDSEVTRTASAAGVAAFTRTWSTRGEWYVRARVGTTTYNASAWSPMRRLRVS
jgi:hypothetical protein